MPTLEQLDASGAIDRIGELRHQALREALHNLNEAEGLEMVKAAVEMIYLGLSIRLIQVDLLNSVARVASVFIEDIPDSD